MPFWVSIGNSRLSIKIDAELPPPFACWLTLTRQRLQDNRSESETHTNCWLEFAAHRGANSTSFCLSVVPVRTSKSRSGIAWTRPVCLLSQTSNLTPRLPRWLRSDAVCRAGSFAHHAYRRVMDFSTRQRLAKVCRHFSPVHSLRCQHGLCFPSFHELPHKKRGMCKLKGLSLEDYFSYQSWLNKVEIPKTSILQKSYFIT